MSSVKGNKKKGSNPIKEFILSLTSSFKGIRYHKRRSVSLIAGLVLGIAILSGIFIYSTVLINNVYGSIIAGSPSEIRIDYDGNFTDSQIQDYTDNFLANPKISDAKVLYGSGRVVTTTSGFSTNTYTTSYLQVQTGVIESSFGEVVEGKIIPQNFFDGEIGNAYRQGVVSGSIGALDEVENSILIDTTVAENGKLSVGDVLDEITVEASITDPVNVLSSNIVDSVSIQNVTIVGIVDLSLSASAGLFDVILQTQEIYIPSSLFSSNSSFFETLKANAMRFSLLKIDESKFSLTNPAEVNSQINLLINEFEEDPNLIGTNLVSAKLLPFQILSVFIFIFDIILTIPVVVLSMYLLSFGIDLSISERGYQVGVLKTQGANKKQIKRKILGETLILAIFGLLFGYFLAILGGWVIGTAKGFMSWDIDYALFKLADFFVYDQTAFLFVGGAIVIIMLLLVNEKSDKFIEQEVYETVRRTTGEKKDSWMRRNRLDIVFFLIGFSSLLIAVTAEIGVNIDLGLFNIFISFFGPLLLWIGGGSLVFRLVVFSSNRLEGVIKVLVKDVSLLARSNIFRHSGDIPRLAVIITLTISFAILANVQGQTGEVNSERTVIWTTGSDAALRTKTVGLTSISESLIKNVDTNIDLVMGIQTNIPGFVKNDPISIFSVESNTYDDIGIWQSDNFIGSDRTEVLGDFKSSPLTNCLIGSQLLRAEALSVGGTVSVDINTFYWDGTMVNNTPNFSFGPRTVELTISGTFDHLPGGIGANNLVIDHSLSNELYNLTDLSGSLDFGPITISSSSLGVLTDFYLIKLKTGLSDSDITQVKNKLLDENYVQSVNTIRERIRESYEIQNVDFGIPGLLTADFLISLIAATLGTYIFMSLLMEQRKKEFAILRSYGATKGQIVKLVFSEVIILLLVTISWGLILGICLSYIFNGFFEFLDIWITPVTSLTSFQLSRIVVYDWVRILLTVALAFGAMVLATYLSVRNVLKSNISLELREL